ncbi:MAG: hypothetical protein ACU843_17055 [Gammaproteobacteria bacterium]
MNLLLQASNLNIAHVQSIVRGMYAVALTDGVHDTELVLMREFYEQCARDSEALASFQDVVSTPFDHDTATRVLNTEELKRTFIASCVFLGYADGNYSAKEREQVKSLGSEIGLNPEQIGEIENLVADQLMAQLAHIENLEALKEVSGEIRAK